jgi:hypothetical protein
LFGNLASDHFSGKLFSKVCTWGDDDSNDTSLNSVSGPGADCIVTQTDIFEY